MQSGRGRGDRMETGVPIVRKDAIPKRGESFTAPVGDF